MDNGNIAVAFYQQRLIYEYLIIFDGKSYNTHCYQHIKIERAENENNLNVIAINAVVVDLKGEARACK